MATSVVLNSLIMSAQNSGFETQLFEKSIEESRSKRWTPAPLTAETGKDVHGVRQTRAWACWSPVPAHVRAGYGWEGAEIAPLFW